MFRGKGFLKGLFVALVLTTFGGITVNASAIRDTEIGYHEDTLRSVRNETYSFEELGTENYYDAYGVSSSDIKNYIRDSKGNVVTYNKADDFNRYGIFKEFIHNSYKEYQDILYVRKGLSAKNFLDIIVCNQPTHMIDDEFTYSVCKNSDGTMSVSTFSRLEEREGMREKYTQIINKIITEDMSDYEKAKAIYDYIYDNIDYTKGVKSNSYDILLKGASGNSDSITAIAGKLLSRANIKYQSVVGISANNKYHYFNIIDIGGKSYVFDVSLDLANGNKYGHFLSATSKLKEYKLGNLQQQFLHASTKDYRE